MRAARGDYFDFNRIDAMFESCERGVKHFAGIIPGIDSSCLNQFRHTRAIICSMTRRERANPALLPADWARGSGRTGELRTIGDFVAGMTDRFAIARHEEIVGPVNLPPDRF